MMGSKFEVGQKVRYTGNNFMNFVKDEIYTIYAIYTAPHQPDKIETVEVPHVVRSYSCFEEIKQEVTYSVGQFFTQKNSTDVYVLVQTAANVVSLVCLQYGNRYMDGNLVDNVQKITEEEFANICGGKEFVEVGLDYSIVQTPSK